MKPFEHIVCFPSRRILLFYIFCWLSLGIMSYLPLKTAWGKLIQGTIDSFLIGLLCSTPVICFILSSISLVTWRKITFHKQSITIEYFLLRISQKIMIEEITEVVIKPYKINPMINGKHWELYTGVEIHLLRNNKRKVKFNSFEHGNLRLLITAFRVRKVNNT